MGQWVIVELSAMAEDESPDVIRASIRHIVKNAEVFVPASLTKQGDSSVVHWLVQGYAFVKLDRPVEKYLKLDDTKYVCHVVRKPVQGKRHELSCIEDKDIERFKLQMKAQDDQGIDVGDQVVITSGPYKNITAIVIEDIVEMDSVQVSVELRSKDSLLTLPRSFLRLNQKNTPSKYVLSAKGFIANFDKWFSLFSLNTDFSVFEEKSHHFLKLTSWSNRAHLYSSPVDTNGLRSLYSKIELLQHFHKRLDEPLAVLTVCQQGLPDSLKEAIKKYSQLNRIVSLTNTIQANIPEGIL